MPVIQHLSSTPSLLRSVERREKLKADCRQRCRKGAANRVAPRSRHSSFHAAHGDRDCPVCGGKPGLTGKWAEGQPEGNRATARVSPPEATMRIERPKQASAGDGAARRHRRKTAWRNCSTSASMVSTPRASSGKLARRRSDHGPWRARRSHLESHHEAFADAVDDAEDVGRRGAEATRGSLAADRDGDRRLARPRARSRGASRTTSRASRKRRSG